MHDERHLDSDIHWWAQADCRFFGPSPFFGPDSETPTERLRRENHAKRICAGCSVADECLRYAVDIGEQFGIWGGTSERERRSLTRA
ncbi:transcription factor WhiB [Rhodococcus sp. SMB37]|uniref:WhiB family transcriptional regulator n=1 Tax=Rhodococcus sp. SMB37 TaxID=2512213 RepID=UPI00104F5270|nr:WhiB family transcriptional regulator [Rhodococcus sp. SMB37]TCN46278.1 transcription factor WhiB [Rhodococcus sp. SMB37]